MDYESIKQQLLSYPGAVLEFPFDAQTPVFKVAGKMFALVSPEADPLRMNLKCDPADALVLRAQFSAIQPGYHMNKDHWNTLVLDGSLPWEMCLKLMDDSYHLVRAKLSRAQQADLSD